jgi:flagellar hook-associated protein 3 FlgL
MLFRHGLNAMQQQQSGVATTQQQIATGKRILSPSDDPVGAQRVLDLQESLGLNQRYQQNADRAAQRLAVEESALDGVVNVLQRVRELAIQGNNDTQTAEDRRAIAIELEERLEELVGLANTRDGNGEFLFAGNTSHTQPFVHGAGGSVGYNGDDGARQLPVGPGYQVAVGDTGNEAFMRPSSVFQTVQGLVDAFNTPATDAASRAGLHGAVDQFLTDVDQSMEQMSMVRAEIGARLNAVESQKRANEDLALQLSEAISTIQDVDYAEAISRFNQQLTALQAAQQSFLRVQDLSLFKFL